LEGGDGLVTNAIIVVGRATTAHDFGHEVSDLLYNGYGIIAIHPLGEPGLDEMERFLAFIGEMGSDELQFPFETQVMRLTSSTRTARQFEDFETALEYAKENYDLDNDRVEAHERFERIREKFPPPTAREIEQFLVFQALMNFGAFTLVRGMIDDEPCVVIATMTQGPDEMRISKLAVLMNDDIGDRLKVPYELYEEDDDD
jgi:hypothetical protein